MSATRCPFSGQACDNPVCSDGTFVKGVQFIGCAKVPRDAMPWFLPSRRDLLRWIASIPLPPRDTVTVAPDIGWNVPAHDPDAHLGAGGGE